MPASDTPRAPASAQALTIVAHASFVPIGIVTVLLAPLLPTLSAAMVAQLFASGRAVYRAIYRIDDCGRAVRRAGRRWGFRFAMKAGLVVMAVLRPGCSRDRSC